jgi:hypothetical protein
VSQQYPWCTLRRHASLVFAAGLSLVATTALAQGVRSVPGRFEQRPLLLVGSGEEDRLRLAQIIEGGTTAGWLIRSMSTLAPASTDGAGGFSGELLLPVLQMTWNSDLPFSLNDGSMWAGRGTAARVTAGVRGSVGPLSITIAPEIAFATNGNVMVVPAGHADRSPFASPWHTGTYSADIPLRFGDRPMTGFSGGQSSLAVGFERVVAGFTTEDQWWGPGIRNALVLSNNAAGVPHFFVRTARPLRTRIGEVEARWIVGGLSESLFFDRDSSNDVRSLSAAVATLRMAAEPGLTVGIARAVYAAVAGSEGISGHALDVLTQWGQSGNENAEGRDNEQIVSLFGRWVFPESGIEVYGEWARQLLPRSIRDLLIAPQRSLGYTLGVQWARPLPAGAVLRVQAEATKLEQTPEDRGVPAHGFYLSRYVAQGYTNRGQVIGAAIGPGGSSQWLSIDRLTQRWHAGVNVGRIRWEDESYYQQPTGIVHLSHDVSLLGGLRGGMIVAGVDVQLELLLGRRFNYLFENAHAGYLPDPGADVTNRTLRLSVSPAARRP